jgi:proteic killer suppression protein
MILNFRNKETALVWSGSLVRSIPAELQHVARRKLRMMNSATHLVDLRMPPGNRLEALKGDRVGQYSIRINERWRICFVWQDGDCAHVEIVDYH